MASLGRQKYRFWGLAWERVSGERRAPMSCSASVCSLWCPVRNFTSSYTGRIYLKETSVRLCGSFVLLETGYSSKQVSVWHLELYAGMS